MSGQPAASISLFRNSAGVSIGIQLASRFGEAGMLFRISAQLERARPRFDVPRMCSRLIRRCVPPGAGRDHSGPFAARPDGGGGRCGRCVLWSRGPRRPRWVCFAKLVPPSPTGEVRCLQWRLGATLDVGARLPPPGMHEIDAFDVSHRPFPLL